MKVTLLRHTPDPETAVALAARLCYSDALPEELARSLEDGEVHRMVRMLRNLGHESPFEHAVFTFAVSGVSRSLTHQLVRHRIASYSQRSQRYVSEEGFQFVIPPSIRAKANAASIYSTSMAAAQRAYKDLIAAGVPKEDARYVLPNACKTSIIVTMNARSLFNFFRTRCCRRAQWEIRAMAYRMLREAKRVAPVIFEKSGSPCEVDGVCPEGPMSCGRIQLPRRDRR